MAALSFSASAGEALVLGLATGPVCLATCGPVVVPWMMVQPQGVRGHSRQLFLFLAARLAGYLVFACAAWLVGSAIPHSWTGRSWLMGGIQILLAAALVVYAAGWPHRRCVVAKTTANLVQIGEAPCSEALGSVGPGIPDRNQSLPAFSRSWRPRRATCPPIRGAFVLFLLLCRNRSLVLSVLILRIPQTNAGSGHSGPHGRRIAGLLVWLFRGFHPDREDISWLVVPLLLRGRRLFAASAGPFCSPCPWRCGPC